MEELAPLVLSDKDLVVDDKLLSSVLGDNMTLWSKLIDDITSGYSNSAGTWNYYNDGHQWLFKMVYKKKTFFWAAMHAGSFRITFYFGNKAEPVLMESDLPQSVKDNFLTAKRYGSIRAISTRVMNNDDLNLVLKLAEIKSKLK